MSGPSERRHIGFRVGGACAALPMGIVREVTDRPLLVRVPGSHAFVSGVALYEGVALPVYDLSRCEALWSRPAAARGTARPEEAGHLIVCDWGEVSLGLLGDEIDLVTEPGPGDGLDESGDDAMRRCDMKREFIKRMLRQHGEPVALLDTDRLFASLGVPAAEAARKEGVR